MKCENCIHYGICVVNSYCHEPCGYYEEDRPHEKWEYLKDHITEMRDADGELNQKQTCHFILELMGVIEREGEASDKTFDNR